MQPIPFEIKKKVMPSDLDDLQHVNNLRYIEWVLEISELHWKKKTDEAIRKQFGWVVLEHHIVYKKPAKLGDTLHLTTWISSYHGVKSTRKTQLHTPHKELVLEAKTLWCFIDLQHQKPVRIPPHIVEPYFILPPHES